MQFPILINYLVSLGLSHPDIVRFVQGDAEEISKKENYEGTFPLWWVETPEPQLNYDNEQINIQWAVNFLVLCKYDGSLCSEQAGMDTSLRILVTLLHKLVEDYEGNVSCLQEIDMVAAQIDQVLSHADSMVGFRVSLPLNTAPHHDSTDILTTVPYVPPTFTKDGNTYTETSAVPSGYERHWKYQPSTGKKGYGTEATLTIPDTITNVYVELTYLNPTNNHKLTRSMLSEQGQADINLPYAKNPYV